jgi:hypothetical protein
MNMVYNFAFTTREEYVAYRANWRAQYKALTLEIRQNKRDQVANRGNDNSVLQSKLHYLRLQANRLMEERTNATKYKNQQMALAIPEAA